MTSYNLAKERLLIVSDTPMWRGIDGKIVVYEPTLREIEAISSLFGEIVWIGFHRQNYVFGNGRPTRVPTINFKLLLPSGGANLISKIKSVLMLPYYWIQITGLLVKFNFVHMRGPSVPALIATLLSFVFRKKKYWIKYAGNWGGENAPFFYRLQKKILLRAPFARVTINGNWPDQLPHILTFQNPCFDETEVSQAFDSLKQKSFDPPYELCFVGRLEEAKGVGNLIRALSVMKHKRMIGAVSFAGDGSRMQTYKDQAKSLDVPCNFLGSLDRTKLNTIYRKSHIIILPSVSEGFPKVISEASAFGAIPVITDISALSQVIHHGVNGFLMPDNLPQTIAETLDMVVSRNDLLAIAENARSIANNFTYEKFLDRLRVDVFN